MLPLARKVLETFLHAGALRNSLYLQLIIQVKVVAHIHLESPSPLLSCADLTARDSED